MGMCVQESATILGPQNPTQGSCDMYVYVAHVVVLICHQPQCRQPPVSRSMIMTRPTARRRLSHNFMVKATTVDTSELLQ